MTTTADLSPAILAALAAVRFGQYEHVTPEMLGQLVELGLAKSLPGTGHTLTLLGRQCLGALPPHATADHG